MLDHQITLPEAKARELRLHVPNAEPEGVLVKFDTRFVVLGEQTAAAKS